MGNDIHLSYYDDGQIKEERWLLGTCVHRIGGPAFKMWYNVGVLRAVGWIDNGVYHRTDGPAFQSWYENGRRSREGWYIRGTLHQAYGPAHQEWYGDGRLQKEEWAWLGRAVTKCEHPFIKALHQHDLYNKWWRWPESLTSDEWLLIKLSMQYDNDYPN